MIKIDFRFHLSFAFDSQYLREKKLGLIVFKNKKLFLTWSTNRTIHIFSAFVICYIISFNVKYEKWNKSKKPNRIKKYFFPTSKHRFISDIWCVSSVSLMYFRMNWKTWSVENYYSYFNWFLLVQWWWVSIIVDVETGCACCLSNG